MRICIHRGTSEIGGTCIELEAEGKRIALDVGLPLDAPDEGHESLLPAVSGFRGPDDSLLGVVISHAHQDHYGLARHIRPGVPVYIGEAAHNIMKAASAWVPYGMAFDNPRFIAHRKGIEIGPFRITPYLVDHSAFDAYSLLVEAGGKRVFYSGDFRAHGRKARLFEAMIEHPPKDIDVLLMEGTTIGRAGTDEGFPTEADLEDEFVRAFRETEGLHLVWASAQNIDRMVTIFRAAKKADRLLVIDLYTAVVLEATGRDTIPQSDWDRVRLYIPHAQRVTIMEKGLFRDRDRHSANRIFPEHLPSLKDRAVMLFRPLTMRDNGVRAVLDGARLSYSMWQGYLKDESTAWTRKWLDEQGIPLEVIHTSGHASVADLKRFAVAMSPRMLVPIHSFETARFGEFFENVVRQEDGVWWEV
ncbi:MAG: MBL fold metallo-hydrolase [Bryobacterales bacterium]|nr:MBL fold metallo-hydrolase [Bryobacterales bacterium]